uniref:Plastid-encoded RNA polymerase subunit alpha n=1 Tax=Pseudomuriella schumacherensis TaxID=889459 RepID=A0A140HB70_PSESB|nr:alpha subunit of RNA polymerase [Pseudomuriella schumacherensis]AMO01419.1 alpha subunit of RNA polymerase [Pseudomuriella schumacherensis]
MAEFFCSCKESKIENRRSFYGCFAVGPFNPGQGLTVANALRRTLLSELKGIAITSVEIDGVTHEYSTLPGIRESVLDVLLNLKEIVLTSSDLLPFAPGCFDLENLKNDQQLDQLSESSSFLPYYLTNKQDNVVSSQVGLYPENVLKNNKAQINKTGFYRYSDSTAPKELSFPQIGYLQARGPGIVKAFDLKLPSSIVCVDPDQYIATLSENGILNFKFTIDKGENCSFNVSNFLTKSLPKKNDEFFYQTQPKKTKKEKNTLLIDALFMPVNKVNYIIESYQGGPITNPKEKLKEVVVLEIWTNGSVHPRQAFYDALKNLNSLFSQLEKIKILNSAVIESVV